MSPTNDQTEPGSFEQLASEEAKESSLTRDFWHFLSENKKWWLAPIVLALLLIGVLLVLSSSAIAPFIYTLF